MEKSELAVALMKAGKAAELLELLQGLSVFSKPPHSQELSSKSPPLHLTRCVNAARNHLRFVSKFGTEHTHVVEGDMHHFSSQQKFEQWLAADAPGISITELRALAKAHNIRC
jgi:hypothetical protein